MVHPILDSVGSPKMFVHNWIFYISAATNLSKGNVRQMMPTTSIVTSTATAVGTTKHHYCYCSCTYCLASSSFCQNT